MYGDGLERECELALPVLPVDAHRLAWDSGRGRPPIGPAMRTFRGARQVTGKQPVRGMMRDTPRPFRALYGGMCRGCGMPYRYNDLIVSPGKGQGALHPRCFKARSGGVFAQQAARKAQEAKGT